MASVNENLNPQRAASAGNPLASPTTKPLIPSIKPKIPSIKPPIPDIKPRAPMDKALIAVRPQSDAERQHDILQSVRAAQGHPAEPTNTANGNGTPSAKIVADSIGIVDGIREGARVATSSDEIARLPLIGKAVRGGTRVGRVFSAVADSQAGKAVALALKQHKVLAPAARFLGRVAPFAGVAVAGYDIYDATKTNKDPKASMAEKILANTKATLSGIAGAAGVATLALAPTGVGAAIAGGIALGAGLLSLGADLWLGSLRKDRGEAKD